MPLQHTKVLIFGATGEVGSAAALEASTRGAQVYLAMRDPSAPNQWLSPAAERTHNLTRVRADLSDPASCAAAITSTGATAVSLYSVRAADHMRGTLAALAAAGAQHLVFLSTNAVRRAWTVPGDLTSIPQSFFVPWKHAQVELALAATPLHACVIRPGFFASNPFRMYLHREPGAPPRARLIAQDIPVDPLDPADIGRVAGALLVEPALARDTVPHQRVSVVTLHGPALLSQREQWALINGALAVRGLPPVQVQEIGADEYAANLTAQHGTPRPIALSLARSMAERFRFEDEPDYAVSVGNVERITGRKAVRFDEFVDREVGRYF